MLVGEQRSNPRPRGFDVICAGEALLNVGTERTVSYRPGGGAINVALALAKEGLRVGLVSVVPDDTRGRALVERIAASGVDIGGVELASPSRGLVFVKGGARQVLSAREEDQPITVPAAWSSRVLLLSGMSPVVSHAGALCRAARDARVLRMVLREADVVWCSTHDLFGLNMDMATMRAALRPGAVLVASDGAGNASASGPFGEVAHALGRGATLLPLDEGDAFTVAICAELARAAESGEGGGALWARALRRAHASVA